MQISVDDFGIFTKVEARKLPPSPRWSPSQGIPRKGQALGWVTQWIAPGLLHAQVGLQCASPGSLKGPCLVLVIE
jgi:hypothetical protein